MSRWNHTVPRYLPMNGQSFFVFGTKCSNGTRIEISGRVPTKIANQMRKFLANGELKDVAKVKP